MKKTINVNMSTLVKKYNKYKLDNTQTAGLAAALNGEQTDVISTLFSTEEQAALSEAADTKLAKTLVHMLVTKHEFYANLMMHCERQTAWEIGNIRTVAIGTRLILEYDPIFVLDSTVKQLEFYLVHEATHIVLRHPQRFDTVDNTKIDISKTQVASNSSTITENEASANDTFGSKDLAIDMAANAEIDAGFKAYVTPKDYIAASDCGIMNTTAEDMNKALVAKFVAVKPQKKPQSPDDNTQQNQQNNSGGGSNNNNGGSNNNTGGNKPHVNKHKAAQYTDPAQRIVLDAQTSAIIKDAVEQSKDIGDLPAHLKEEIDKLTRPPKVDWKAQLRNFIAAKIPAQSTKTWARLNRKFPYLLKGKKKRYVPLVTLAIDTSGSVSSEALKAMAVEIDAIRKIYKIDIEVIQCDAEINRVDIVNSHQPFPEIFVGRGGTSFEPVWEYLADKKRKRRPDVVIYLSDLQVNSSDFPAKPTLYAKLFVSVDESSMLYWKSRIKNASFIYLNVDKHN